MKIVIIGNGEINNRELIHSIVNEDDAIICCDGGLKYAFEEGLIPQCIIGDFDSVPEQILRFFELKGVPVKRFPEKKDFTDMELCLEFAVSFLKEINAEEIVILGGLGSRFDHSLANANILLKAVRAGVRASLVNENNRVYLTDKKISFRGEKGGLVSLLPFSEKVLSVTTKGLYYELNKQDLEFGVSLGVSNVMTEDSAEIEIKQGYLFVILSNDIG